MVEDVGTAPELGLKQVHTFANLHTKWHTNQEIANILISAQTHPEWIGEDVLLRPQSGTQVIYRKKEGFSTAHYKLDGYVWKKRKDGKLIREDHMKLKVKGVELINANYVHSSLVPTFHRRSYWLLTHPDLVLCHYLNVTPQNQPAHFSARECLLQSLRAHAHLSKADMLAQITPIMALEQIGGDDRERWLVNLVDCAVDGPQTHSTLDGTTQSIVLQLPSTPNALSPQQLLITMDKTQISVLPRGPAESVTDCCEETDFAGLGHSPVARSSSCSSACRTGMSSMVLKRQPSAFSDMQGDRPLNQHTSRSSDSACCSLTEEQTSPHVPQNLAQNNFSANGAQQCNTKHAILQNSAVQHDSMALLQDYISAADSVPQHPSSIPAAPPVAVPPVTLITEYCPDWAYETGCIKVLVSGPWYSSTQKYSCRFDSTLVPAVLVQNGVIRCYCPPHTYGAVALCVLCDENVISNQVIFNYRQDERQAHRNTVNSNLSETEAMNGQLISGVLERLECLERCLSNEKRNENYASGISKLSQAIPASCSELEDRLCSVVERMSRLDWVESAGAGAGALRPSPHGLTLLHLVAALGFSNLMCLLFRWRAERPSLQLAAETNTRKLDVRGRSALYIACAYGHVQCVKLLVSYDKYSMDIRDAQYKSPIDIAFLNARTEVLDVLLANRDHLDDNRACSSSVHDTTAFWVLTGGMTSGPPTNMQQAAGRQSAGSMKRCRRQSTIDVMQRSGETEATSAGEKRKHRLSMQDIEAMLNQYEDTPINMAEPPSDLDDSFSDDGWVESVFDPDVPLDMQVPDSPRTQQMLGCLMGAEGKQQERTHMLGLAEKIIAAMPDRIKRQASSSAVPMNVDMSDPLIAGGYAPPSPTHHQDLPTTHHHNFFDYRCVNELCASPSCSTSVTSPSSNYLQTTNEKMDDESEEKKEEMESLGDFFNATRQAHQMTRHFSDLTLSDLEQRELYEAAKVIQTAYRQYKARMRTQTQQPTDAERQAATVIQSYYRRYKQFCYFKKLHRAAMLIQKHFRTYKATKRKQGPNEEDDKSGTRFRRHIAAVRIQHAYRGHYMRKRQAAAMKIQKFMRQSRHKLRKVRSCQNAADGAAAGNTRTQDSLNGLSSNPTF